VFTYQGDGDLAAIGTAETIHTCNRGENLLIVFINNAIYGMTGGQMAPTTMPGQVTSTSPFGRKVEDVGQPIRMCELLSSLATPAFIERVSLSSPKHIIRARKAILKAFRYQAEGRGFSFVECLSTCPTNWGVTPLKALEWLEQHMMPYYPVQNFKDFEPAPAEGGKDAD
jgi:2-oxoglutarate ferredoxin oxidoreductase subunit beta